MLNQAHERLWRVAVYLHPDDYARQATLRLVGSAARDLFGIRSRYADHEVDQPYLATVFDLHARELWPHADRDETIRKVAEAAASASQPKSLDAAIKRFEAAVGSPDEQVEADGGGDPTLLPDG